ncbi:hypothetical protein ACO0LB_10195 [Undibacterium sp. SXout7W]|uniref:hypothetical protein n=1 Tax=Undibacterium sp. SXout7W TaxID=3413049 RepID=UPI003BF03032
MNYEEIKEQCAKFLEDQDCAHGCMVGKELADKLRGMPLPEVGQEPAAWLDDDSEPVSNELKAAFPDGFESYTTPLYLLPPDAEDLRKENEQLRGALTAMMKMKVKGHQLQDRLQFSDDGREILNKVNAALKGGAA